MSILSLAAIPRAADREGLPLSYAQQRLWFLAQLEGGSEAYHIPWGVRLQGSLDRAALKRALDRIVWRHEALRSSFERVEDRTVQRIGPAGGGFALEEHDLSGEPEAAAELERRLSEAASRPFDLAHGPLLRGQLIRLGEREHVLAVAMHHIVSDGWSMGLLSAELSALYGAYSGGGEDPLEPLGIQYADYAVWQREWLSGEELERQSEYWRGALQGAPAVLELPLDRARPARREYAGAVVPVEWDADLTRALKALSRRHGMTLYMTVLAGWAAVLARLSGQPEVVIGTPVANRTRAELEGLIGFFVNTQALRVGVAGTVAELLRGVKERALDAQAHQDLPFERVVELVQAPRSLSHTPVFQAMLAWQNQDEGTLDLPGLTVTPVEMAYGVAKFDLELELSEAGGRIVGGLKYAAGLFERATMERQAGYLRRMLEAMAADERQAVDRIEVLSGEERQRLLVEWNRTGADYPRQCIHELFEAQAERTPQAVAVVAGEVRVSYAELNARANRLAHELIARGVKPDTFVAVCLERGVEMVVGLLAILKAGGAYVPLDPAYPRERLAYMLADSAPAVVLTQAGLLPLLGAAAPPALLLDGAAAGWADRPAENPRPGELGLHPRRLAYLIYTSGSTGRPKGVMIEHRQTVNFLCWARETFARAALSKVLFSTSLNFDLAVYECFVPLTMGGRIEMVADALALRPERHDISLINTVPSALQTLLEGRAIGDRVEVVNVAGEALKRELAERLFAQTRVEKLYNLYGPSETTTYSSGVEMNRETGFLPHIGRPIANTQIYILDAHGEPAPTGAAGEIYIGGAGVARGYLNRPELTAERFLKDPFAEDPDARMYKTGDLGRWLPEGAIEYLGRNDQQVKIRGFRIELGEIEARLAEHGSVREAVVVAREDRPGEKRLVAYVTGREREAIEVEALRAHLAARLPGHMVPAAYVR